MSNYNLECFACSEMFQSSYITNYCQKEKCQAKRPNRHAKRANKKPVRDKLYGVASDVKKRFKVNEQGDVIRV